MPVGSWRRETLARNEAGFGCRSLRATLVTDDQGDTEVAWLDLQPSSTNRPGAGRWPAMAPGTLAGSSLRGFLSETDWRGLVADPSGVAAFGWATSNGVLHLVTGSLATDEWREVASLRCGDACADSLSDIDSQGNVLGLVVSRETGEDRLLALTYSADAGSP
jgi:hypothetical protein